MIQDYKVLNDVLRKIASSQDGFSLTDYLKYTYNLHLYKESKMIGAQLLKDGYILIPNLTDQKDTAFITEKGKTYIKSGGYAIDFFQAVSRALSNTNQPKEETKVSETSINRNMINYALEELYHLEDKIEEIINPFSPALSKYLNNISVVLKHVFPPEHQIFKKESLAVITKDDLQELCTNAINYLEFELLKTPADLSTLHPLIMKHAGKQFLNKHYRDSVANAFTAVVEFCKEKYELKGNDGKLLDGKPMMEQLFNIRTPKVKFSDEIDKQEGLKMIFAGSVSAFRNKHVHKLNEIEDENYALQLLQFASLLIRLSEKPTLYQ
jgi:uncharacterized protein (TIGR02391 family)